MNIQHALLRELRKSSTGGGIDLHSAGHDDGAGGRPNIVLHRTRGGGAREDGPVIKLASLRKHLSTHLPADVDPEDPDYLPTGARIELYSIVYKNFRPGPAFRAQHALKTDALDARINPNGPTWRAYLDSLNAPADGVSWSERIAHIARHCVRLDPLHGEQAGSGFLIGPGRILTAAHVMRDLGWTVPQATHKPARILYNQVHVPSSQPPAEAGVRSSGYTRHPDEREDAGFIAQMADWQAELDAAFIGGEFSGLAGLEWQETPLAESDLKSRPIAVIGHPLRGNAGGSIADLPVVYGDAQLGTKRFMPGFLDSEQPLGQDGMLLKHDCSTLGGASGSCAIDLLTGKIIGIHVSGSVTLHNFLVPMWRLAEWLDSRAGVVVAGAEFATPAEAAEVAMESAVAAPSATKLVMAFAMDDEDIELASKLMSPEQPGKEGREAVDRSGGSFVIGEATDEEIGTMTEAGLMVQELPPAAPLVPRPESAPPRWSPTDRLRRSPYVMRLRGPLTPGRTSQLEKCGLQIRDALPSGAVLVELSPVDQAEVAALPFVLELRDPAQVMIESPSDLPWSAPLVPPGLEQEPVQESVSEKSIYDLLLFPETDPADFSKQLADLGIELIGSSGRKLRIRAYEEECDALPPVEVRELYIPPVLHNLHASRVMRVVAMQDDHRTLPWDGSGQVVAMADTGVDDTHPAFKDRILEKVALGRAGRTDDPHGHGTHVAGSILGNGKSHDPAHESPPLPTGIAPGATLYCQSLLGDPIPGNPFPLSGLDRIISLGDLFEPAYQAGARIHNNSWGGVAKSLYRLHSQEVDEYIAHRRDMLVVISAGNDGSTRDPLAPAQRFSTPGFVDWYSLCAPATSKNALTVGASRSSITTGGYSRLPHRDAFGGRFPSANPATTPDISTELVSGNSNDLAGFSSRGPTDTLQIKPDVVAPGTDIVSARSIDAPGEHYSGPFAGNGSYAHMCGTSMAAPLASGCAAVVRHYYKDQHQYEEPSAALIKATLINGTRTLDGPHANAIPGGFPNGHQGFGCIDMAATLPASGAGFVLHYYDNWRTSASHLSNSATGRYRDFTFTFDPAPGAAASLRVCLVHTDPPGRSVINVLQLRMQAKDAAGARTDWYGNQGQQTSLAPALPWPYRNNNVAIIRPLNPRPGTYKIRVELINLLKGPTQDFALVVTGTGISAWTPPAVS